MTVSQWQEVSEPLQAEHDDVVIGAGIVGSYAATLLHQRGRDVALVDARFPAAGASGRNAGFVLTSQRETYPTLIAQVGHPAARQILAMVCDNVARMRALAKQYEVPWEEGAIHLAETQADARELEEWARAFAADGVEVEFAQSDPYGAGYAASLQVEGDFMVQPARLTEAIAFSSGATFYDHNEVYRIEAEGQGPEGAWTPRPYPLSQSVHRHQRIWLRSAPAPAPHCAPGARPDPRDHPSGTPDGDRRHHRVPLLPPA